MALVLLYEPDGSRRAMRCRQARLGAALGGALTFVGGVGEGVYLLARRVPEAGAPINALVRSHPHCFLADARGVVACVASDADGEEVDVDEASAPPSSSDLGDEGGAVRDEPQQRVLGSREHPVDAGLVRGDLRGDAVVDGAQEGRLDATERPRAP